MNYQRLGIFIHPIGREIFTMESLEEAEKKTFRRQKFF